MDAGPTGIHRVNGRRAAVAQSPAQACRVKLEELVITHGIKPDQEPLANQECEQTVKKDRVFTRAEVEPQTQKLTDRAQFVQAEALDLAWGTARPNESVCKPQLVELRIQSPELVEMLLRSSPDLLLVHLLQAAARHCQFATELIENRPNERLPPCYRQPGHARMKTPASPVGTHVFQSPIAHAKQADVLQVRLDDPPAAAEIFVEPALCQVGERVPDILRRAGLRVQLGVAGDVPEAETARVNDLVRHCVEGQIALPLQRREKRRAKQGNMNEVVEVPGLERGVLAVVGEGEQLVTRAGRAARVPQERRGQHGCRAAPRLAGERGKLAELALAGRVEFAAVQAKRKRRGLPPHPQSIRMRLCPELSVRQDPDGPGHTITPGPARASPRVEPLRGDAIVAPVVLGWRQHEVAGLIEVLLVLQADRVRQELRGSAEHMVIILTALAAEPDGGEDASPARLNLSFQRMLTPVRRLQRRKERPPLADELVQLEREGSPPVVALQFPSPIENLPQPRGAGGRVSTGGFGQGFCRSGQGARHPTPESAIRLGLDTELGLHPSRQRVAAKEIQRGGNGSAKGRGQLLCRGFAAFREGDQRLLDHLVAGERMTEQPLSEIGHRGATLLRGGVGAGHHSRAGADVHQPRRGAAFLEPAYQHGHVGPLPAPVRVQLIEYQEPQPAPHAIEESLVLGPDQHQLRHDIVGQHDLRWMLAEALAKRLRSLPGVLGERDRERPSQPMRIARFELLELLNLRVHQRVHGVDDQRGNPVSRRRLAKQRVDDWQEIREALSRPRAGGDDIASRGTSQLDGLDLVPVEVEGLSLRRAKDPRSFLEDQAAAGQFVHRGRAGVGRANLQERVGPEPGLLVQRMIDELPRTVIGDGEEGTHEVAVVGEDLRVEVEDAHGCLLSPKVAGILKNPPTCLNLACDILWACGDF